VGSIFSGLGSTLLKELIAKARRRDTEQLQQLLRQAPKEYSQSHRADPNIVINVPILTSLANQTYLLPLAEHLSVLGQVPAVAILGGYSNVMQKGPAVPCGPCGRGSGTPRRPRQTDVPVDTLARSWIAQLRLCCRFRGLAARKTIKGVVVTAIARELAGFLWAEMAH
jgi:hypothetical protein